MKGKRMNCSKFQLYINDFLGEKIKDEKVLSDFIEHALGCQECYEELEIYYTLQIGLELAEKDASMSFDFAGELNHMIEDYDEGIYANERISFLSKCISILATIVAYITLVMVIIWWF